jgi:hypothetical protein
VGLFDQANPAIGVNALWGHDRQLFGVVGSEAVLCHILPSIVRQRLSINPVPPITNGSGVEDENMHLILITIINIVHGIVVKIGHLHSLTCELLNLSMVCAKEPAPIPKDRQLEKGAEHRQVQKKEKNRDLYMRYGYFY